MSLKNMAYDHPTYTTRQAIGPLLVATGSGGVTPNFVAHSNLQLYGVTYLMVAAGTSTATATGAASPAGATAVEVNGQIFSVLRVFNTATSTTIAPALATQTWGPFIAANLFANGTWTGAIGDSGQYAINSAQFIGTATVAANSGLSNQGGISVGPGDKISIVSGTDATAQCTYVLDYQIQPLASVQA
jgi:hypothetical protein